MSVRLWLRNLFAPKPRTPRKAPARFRPRVEALEDRLAPATFTVSNIFDNVNIPNSLRWAINQANATPGADTINFVPALAGVTINTFNLTITDDVDIQGPLNGPVILSGPSPLFRQFTGNGRLLDIAAGANVSISRLTLKNGDVDNREGFNPPGEAFGGAIRNAGMLTVRESLFYHNAAGDPYGGIGGDGGGAIYNSGSLTVIASSFAGNFAEWGSGGAIYNAGTAIVTNSTFIDNYTGLSGGAIYNAVGGTMDVTNCTILKSGGDPLAYVLSLPVGSHGIANLGTMTLYNTIVADTPAGSDVANGGILTGSHNLIKDGSGGLTGTITGDPMLTPPNYTPHSQYANLAMLPRPGQAGPPFSFAPLPGSPAIDAGNNSAIGSVVDQRGAPRINNGVVDIGAVELGITPVSIVVTTLTDEDSGSIDPALGAGTSLREALSLKLPQDVTITFAPGLAGTIALDASSAPISIADFYQFVPYQRGRVTLVGPGADVITIDGQARASRILEIVSSSLDVSISGLTFARGTSLESDSGGGAIYSVATNLTLSDCAFLDNTARYRGGAIHSEGKLTVNNCTFVGNSANGRGEAVDIPGEPSPFGLGGAIANEFEMTVTDSTFIGNSARSGGAIWTKHFNTNHLSGSITRPTVTSSTFSGNVAYDYGGAILVYSQRQSEPAELTVINSTFSENSAGINGGAIHAIGTVMLYGNTVYGNSAANRGNLFPVVGGGIGINHIVGPAEGTVTLINNIVAGSVFGDDVEIGDFVGNGVLTGSHNLIGDGSGGLPNTITGNPLLAPLGDYGGPTWTMPLLPGSPALNAGTSTDAPAADQRGLARVGGVDIGAFESQGFTLTPVAGSTPQSTVVGTAFANPLAVSVTANNPVEPVNGGVIRFTTPESGASATLTAATATIVGGQAAVTATANAIHGAYDVTASAAGAASVDFHLTNTVANQAPTLAVPAAQTAYEDVDKAITGITVGDPDGGNLTVTLSVCRGKLTLGTTTGLTVSGNGTGAVTLSGSIANLNAALASLVYRGNLNYSGSDTLSIVVSDGSLSASRSVAISVKSAAQQAADLRAQVTALQTAGVLTQKQADRLLKNLELKGKKEEKNNVQDFLREVEKLLRDRILTQAQADALLGPGNVLLLSVSRR